MAFERNNGAIMAEISLRRQCRPSLPEPCEALVVIRGCLACSKCAPHPAIHTGGVCGEWAVRGERKGKRENTLNEVGLIGRRRSDFSSERSLGHQDYCNRSCNKTWSTEFATYSYGDIASPSSTAASQKKHTTHITLLD